MVTMPQLTLDTLKSSATAFAVAQSAHDEVLLFGVTDGKAVGTYIEHKFRDFLTANYKFAPGNSAAGIDLPQLNVDLKVTSAKQPQSSCPFKSARQKIYGLGYSLLVFVYEKSDNPKTKTSRLNIVHTVFVDERFTADFQTTAGIREIIERSGNEDDLVAFMADRMLPVDDIQARSIAQELLTTKPEQGLLTISNALQWRLQYARAIEFAGKRPGVERL